ncbi:MAG: pyrroline-5-carboxylate reductase [Pseudomonadales bacterium]
MNKIAFLGAGNIAHAIIGGLVHSGTAVSRIVAADPSAETRRQVRSLGITTTASNTDAMSDADTVIICVKPDIVAQVLADITSHAYGKFFISVAAGITTDLLHKELGEATPIVRCMPNTPALVRQGMTALYAGKSVLDAHRDTAEQIMGAVGSTLWVNDETDLDIVTAVSGSGPAYFFYLMEAMIAAAEAEGLSESAARQLVLQTAIGSARILVDQEADPMQLRENVTSPGGTTEAAMEVLTDGSFPALVAKAVAAARKRAIDLSKA